MKRLLSISILLVCCLGSVGRSAGQEASVTGNIFGMEWSPDSSAIAIASSEGAWLYWNGDFHQITSGEVYDVTWSYDSTSVALLHWNVNEIQIEVWDVSLPVLPIRLRSFTDNNLRGETLENLDWNPTSNLIAVSGIGIRIWNADTGSLVRTLQPNEPSSDVRWSPDGSDVASFNNYFLAVWDSATGILQYEIEFPLFVGSGSWGNDSQHIAVVQSLTGIPSEVHILDLTQEDFSPTILSYNAVITHTEWRGNTLVSDTNPGLAVWDVRTQQLLPAPPLSIGIFALSPDGSQIAYIQDGVLQIQTVNTPYVAPMPTPTPTNPDLIRTVQSLVSDEDCLLPCWWGLNLGVDNGRAVEDMLYNSFGPSSYQKSDGNDYFGVREGAEYSVFYLHLNTRNEIRDGDLASEGIFFWVLEPEGRFVASRLSSDLPSLSYVDWTPYMPSSLLSKYGTPDLVTFVYPTDMLSGYSMIIRYFDLGLFVGYDFPYKSWAESNKSILICNQMDNDFMYLFRLGVTVVANYSAIPENNPWPTGDKTMWYERRLEDITTFNLETFTEIFSHENVCFTSLPIDEWPDLPPPTE